MGDDVPFCLTNTIDKYSTIGDRYYHNLRDGIIDVRPRIPVRYDFHDAEAVPLKTKQDAEKLLGIMNLSSSDTFYHVSRTVRSKVNTLLSNVLAVILIIVSAVNMRRILRALQSDATLTDNNRVAFMVGFVLSFVVVIFLSCYLVVAWFEIYRSGSVFPVVEAHGFRYFDLTGGVLRTRVARALVVVFVLGAVVYATAEMFNLFFTDSPEILFLLLPITLCLLLLVRFYTTTRFPQPPTPIQKQASVQPPKQKNKSQKVKQKVKQQKVNQKVKQQQVKQQVQMPTQLPAKGDGIPSPFTTTFKRMDAAFQDILNYLKSA